MCAARNARIESNPGTHAANARTRLTKHAKVRPVAGQSGRMAVAATASGSDSSNTRGRTACSCVCTACHDSFTGHGQLGRRASQRSHYPPKQTRHAELLHSARGATLRAVQKLSLRRYGPRVPRRAHLICVISAARQAPWSTCKRRLCCACAVPVPTTRTHKQRHAYAHARSAGRVICPIT